MADVLYHFSEDPSIALFEPHVPATNPDEPPAVWAIDPDHAPLYWFPRDCPRVAVWAWPGADPAPFRSTWSTTSLRVHVIERRWLDRMRATTLYRYTFDGAAFERWPAASGYWVSRTTVTPTEVCPMDDLIGAHREHAIELRTVEDLWPIIDRAQGGSWDFSIVRKANAMPRS